MSFEAAMRNVLEAVVPAAFPDEAPPRQPLPYAVWQQIGGRAIAYVDDSVADAENPFVQVTVWASTRIEANALMRRIEAAMIVATPFTARPMSAMSRAPSDDENVRGAMQDFDVSVRR